MTTLADNLDLRRRRREAGLSLEDVAQLLYGPLMVAATFPEVSRFERGKRVALPHGKTRRDYESVLTAYEMGAAK